jgi:hypothetical protein
MDEPQQLHQKAKPYDLFACETSVCGVMTFIQTEECPVCHQPGILLRRADTQMFGQPPDPARVEIAPEGE